MGKGSGFAVVVTLGSAEKILMTSRGRTRLFASLDTAATFVKDIGVSQFEVDVSRYEPGRLRSARPDRAAALRLTRTRMHQEIMEFVNP